ncbi:unnamed protein product [Tetraodon nigroviridis]|uniref:(spotted green pufferfish) hypothetical protein n=1 Tax=Tetraodon nigroviridis TaxID=99883 RepID=Q4SBN6_TETNG|nr:unnamed protein product [Tetraodon nigroviridis]
MGQTRASWGRVLRGPPPIPKAPMHLPAPAAPPAGAARFPGLEPGKGHRARGKTELTQLSSTSWTWSAWSILTAPVQLSENLHTHPFSRFVTYTLC